MRILRAKHEGFVAQTLNRTYYMKPAILDILYEACCIE